MKVCIVGTNLSSLTLAKALVNLNINVDLLSSKKKTTIDKSRTLGISKSNVDFFNKHIVDINKLTWKLKKIEIFSDNLKKEKLLNFKKNNDYLFSILKNYQLFNILESNLLKSKFFKKLDNKIHLNFNDYNLVINTDFLSPVTKKYFNKKIIKKYNSFALTTIIKHSKITNDVATQIFTKKGPLAFLPISKTETSIVFSMHNSANGKVENIAELIKKYNFKYEIKSMKKMSSFDLNTLSLRSYNHKNILAFGDLLHKIHPLAGQGFNMTVRDIKVLIELIKNKLNLGLALDSTIGVEFEKKLKHKNFIFLNGIDFIHEFFNLERNLKSNILSKSVQLLGKNQSINKFFIKIADRGIYL
ncbi:FAD-dependent monooxygenase [Candidatus Pelagibacter sp.]|nr:FAD-dependent monooxygenase [Candidatus Pelagibacter sp.]